MAAPEAVNFIISDHGDKGSGFRQTFALDLPYKSVLQRNGVTMEDLLALFDWNPDDAAWVSEYFKTDNDVKNLVKFRRRTDFCVCGWRDIKEDFGRNDVSCIRDIRHPLVTYRTPFRVARDEFNV